MKGSSNPTRILIVDDNIDTASGFAFLFHSWGHETRVVHDGPSAIEAACEFQPDVVLLDVGLPMMDGFEVSRRLRSIRDLQGLLIIGSSGYGRPKDRRQAAEAAMDLYLIKPFDPWQLEDVIAKHLLETREQGSIRPCLAPGL